MRDLSGKSKILVTSVFIFMFFFPFIFSSCRSQGSAASQSDSFTTSSSVQETVVESTQEQTAAEPTDEQTDSVEFHDKAVESEVRYLLGNETDKITPGDMETDTIKNTKSLDIYGECGDIQDIIRYFPNITNLTIDKYTGDGDICADLCTFKQLEYLGLTYGGSTLNIDSLARLNQLKGLSLDAPEIRFSDADVLSGFGNLKSISLVHVKQCDLSFLTKIAGVKQVNLLSCGVTDVSPVIGMKQLGKLVISYGKGTEESKGLASFTGITDNICLEKIKRKDSDIVAGYERVRDKKNTYEIFETYDRQYSEEDYQIPQFGITVFKESGESTSEPVKLLSDVIDNEEYGQDYPRFSKIFYLNDVNFDSNQDILLLEGYFGNQGGARYSCWLWNPKTKSYVKNNSFSDIMNVSVDRQNHKILGCWRDEGASHSYAMYEYRNGQFIVTNKLTEEAVDEDTLPKDKTKWQYTEEKLANGKMYTVEQFSVISPSDNNEDNVKYYKKGSYWDLLGDKWTQLDCDGKLADFSIYGSR